MDVQKAIKLLKHTSISMFTLFLTKRRGGMGIWPGFFFLYVEIQSVLKS